MDDAVYQRTKEQRDHFKEMADLYKLRLEAAESIIMAIDRRMGPRWTQKLADALTANNPGTDHGK